jgi:A/G-specific adenine glycosylase
LADFQTRLLSWYAQHRRDLPWRVKTGRPDPYHVLVSESMLQQTQVSTVIPYFKNFLEHFPTLQALATADLQQILRCWQGLGYYTRARNLQACARKIQSDHAGQIPADLAQLLALPGIGRYTAGAIASLAYDIRAPILDGNVTRVLCRLDKIQSDPRDRNTNAALWSRAQEILPKESPGDVNSALMELGATICTPKSPQCLLCPVRQHCQAAAANVQDQIPLPKRSKPTPLHKRYVLCLRDNQGRYLIEQRPEKGRWPSLWQFPTLEMNGRPYSAPELKSKLGLTISSPTPLGKVRHALTHRRYEFQAYTATLRRAASPRVWVALADFQKYPMSKPQRVVVGMLSQ